MRLIIAAAWILAWFIGAAPGQVSENGSGRDTPHRADALEPFEVRSGLVFAERGDRKLALDLYRPKTEGPHPLVLVIHGGGWSMGTRNLGEAKPLAEALAARGLAAASIDYRLAPANPHPAQIEDCRRALQWLRAHAADHGIDGGRVASLGASAGGHLASLLAVQDDGASPDSEDPVARQSTRVLCCVAVITPFDLRPDPEHPPTVLQARAVGRLLGVRVQDAEKEIETLTARALDASPLTWVGPGDPPFLIVSALKDPIIPVYQAQRMSAALGAAKVELEVIEIKDGGHGEWMGRVWEPDPVTPEDYWLRTVRFLRRHLAVTPGGPARGSR